jgi:hypothetical protein
MCLPVLMQLVVRASQIPNFIYNIYSTRPLWWALLKNSSSSNAPQIEALCTNKVVWKCFHFAHVYIIQDHIFRQRRWDKLWCYWGISWVHIPGSILGMLPHLIAWVELLWSSTFLASTFTRAWVLIVIHID